MTTREALVVAAADLSDAGVPDAMGDARRLLAHALGIDVGRVTLLLDDRLTDAQMTRYQSLLGQRRARQPVSQIIGWRDFFGRRFQVTPEVLDPRPETETLIARALELPWATVLDLGTGSGCILVTLLAERAEATGIGVDLSDAALAVATGNAKASAVGDRVVFRRSSWFENVTGHFDLVVSNPPYIDDLVYAGLDAEVREWEPEMALRAGVGGLDAYRRFAGDLINYLAPHGRLLLEIGWDQGEAVADILSSAGLSDVAVHTDLDGRDRVIEASR